MSLPRGSRRRYRAKLLNWTWLDVETIAALICLVSVFSIVMFGVTVRFPDGFAADLVGDFGTGIHHLVALGIRVMLGITA